MSEQEGIVVKSTGSWHNVKIGSGIVSCKAAGKLKTFDIKATNPVTVGDWVVIRLEKEGDVGIITTIKPRKNYIIRKSTNLSKQYHLMAANIDQALLVVSLVNPKTPLEFIDRYLLTAEAYQIEAKIIFNKVDLLTDEKLQQQYEQMRSLYSGIGYDCLGLSATQGNNLDILMDLLKNKITLFSGNSGVGKSTIINAIDPELNLKVSDISRSHKTGKHTTTFSELFPLSIGGYIIDTPGIRGFGIIDVEKHEVGMYFKEIFEASEHCQFHNCTHTHEPNCHVKELASCNKIAESRYKSYLNIYYDENEKYR